jgi:putative MATE family efflux protein
MLVEKMPFRTLMGAVLSMGASFAPILGIEKSRLNAILELSAPIVGGLLAHNVMSLIDTAMVGRLGDAALAGVGVGGFLFLLLFSVLKGIEAGVQAMVSRQVGRGERHLACLDLNLGITASLIVGLVLTVAGYCAFPYLYSMISQDPAVIEQGLSYLRWRTVSIVLIGMAISFQSYWTGVSLAKWSLISLLIFSLSNIFFNYLLIFGNWGFPRMETAGAGLATTIAAFVCVIVNIGLGVKYVGTRDFLRRLPGRVRIKTFVQLSYPESIRQFCFFLGLVVFFAIVSLIGTKELAAFNVLVNIMLVAIFPAMGMGFAAVTLVGQAMGRQDPEDARQWGWEVAKVGGSVMSLFGLILFWFPNVILSLFIVDASTITVASFPLRLMGIYIGLDAFGIIISHALIAAGSTKVVMIWSLMLQWFIEIPLYWIFGFYFGLGLPGIFIAIIFIIILNTSVCSMMWYRSIWKDIQL